MGGIVVNVVESGEVRPFKSESRLTVLIPDFTSRRAIPVVHLFGRSHVELAQHGLQCLWIFWRSGNKVVVVGHDRPCLKRPAVVTKGLKEGLQKIVAALRRVEVVDLIVSAACHKVNARLKLPTDRRMRPTETHYLIPLAI